MKEFVYKTLFVFLLLFLLVQFTVGSKIREIEEKIYNMKSKENAEILKVKIRSELKKAINKENYINKEDAILIKKFIEKINLELDLN